jgi:hypothetical protein
MSGPTRSTVVTVRTTGGQWILESWNPATGTGASRQWTVSGDFTAVRLIGWSSGQPVVVVFQREQGAPVETEPQTAYQMVHSLQVWRLSETGHEVLVRAPHNLMSIDIADNILASGRVRTADPPRFGLLSVLWPGVLVLGAVLLVRRLRA